MTTKEEQKRKVLGMLSTQIQQLGQLRSDTIMLYDEYKAVLGTSEPIWESIQNLNKAITGTIEEFERVRQQVG